uniref:TetR/AcrR family transcriptional regulator n=1 Tax=Nocardia cyriacigeorgica TaxID=135487 RepID=UPI00245473F4
MTTAAASRDDTDSIESRILDAALDQFGQLGIKKTTIEDIARKAGVDRVTVYRRIGSRDDVVRAVALREVNAVLTELDDVAARNDTLADLVADIFVTVVTRWGGGGGGGAGGMAGWMRTGSPATAGPRIRRCCPDRLCP